MLSIAGRKAIEAALARPLQAQLRSILQTRVQHLECRQPDLVELTHFVVMQRGDTSADLKRTIGLTPLVNPIDGARFRSPAFHPWWDWLGRTGDYFEAIISVGNAGFAFVLLIEDTLGVDPELLCLCRTYLNGKA